MTFLKNFFSELRVMRRAFLIRAASTVYSQHGEDAVLEHLLSQPRGFYVDVGCWHPKKFSNTWFLYKRGWNGVNVDLGEVKIRMFKWVRPDDYNVVAAISDQSRTVVVETDKDFSVGEQIVLEGQASRIGFGHSREMVTRTLTDILDHSPFSGKTINLLNVDAEGHDLQVLRGLDFERYSPELILVESYDKTLEALIQSELHGFLSERRFHLINWVGPTLFYKRESA